MSLTIEQQILIEQRVANDAPSQGVAYLLWIFLGLLSGHRFYLGKPSSAILQIISYFFLVGFIWWIIDGFSIPSLIRQRKDQIRSNLILSMGGELPPTNYELTARGLGRAVGSMTKGS